MQSCLTWLLIPVGGIFLVLTLIRWFEQTADAVDRRDWARTVLLVAFPFGVWMFPGRVVAGRPTPVPVHEPVRGMGTVPKERKATPGAIAADHGKPAAAALPPGRVVPADEDEGPPPGTPKEFLGMPVIPPKPKANRPAVDPEKLAKLRQKMREQGMLEDED